MRIDVMTLMTSQYVLEPPFIDVLRKNPGIFD